MLGNGSTGVINFGTSVTTTTTTYGFSTRATPVLVKTLVLPDRIELVYTQASLLANNWGPLPDDCYKVVYSCVDGKWNESAPIYGNIIPATEQDYEFPDELA